MTTIRRLVEARVTPEGDGMVVRRPFPSQAIGRIDPFLLLDEMGPMQFEPGSRKGFPPHPHRGFETVTYLLDGAFEHKDSHGHKGRLGPGDVQWMTAGGGVMHSEMPAADLREKGGRLHGLQLWVNLPKADKMMEPRYQEFPAASLPKVHVVGGWVRILAGQFGGTKAVIDTRTPIQYLHLHLDHAGDVRFQVPAGHAGFLYVLKGDVQAGALTVPEGNLGELQGDGELRVTSERCDAILVTGVPLKEPVFQYGPFVMTTRDEIVQAVEDFQAGRFGRIPA
jgi:hypothetical protein